MLTEVRMSAYNRTVFHFLSQKDSGKDLFDLNPPYQRSSVWTVEQKRGLVKSLLMGLPIGAVVLNHLGYQSEVVYSVIDGKQRIETLRGFVNDEFSVPAEWYHPDYVRETTNVDGVEMVSYSGLANELQRDFHMKPVPSLEAQVKGVEAEAEIFLLINAAGTTQTDEDLARAEQVKNQK